ncbi:MAG: PKD domain-containing protein, partial [Chitinophagaceae bacterium]|nr:PKD domain-containing protein [Chitinophagaceae bacterium]
IVLTAAPSGGSGTYSSFAWATSAAANGSISGSIVSTETVTGVAAGTTDITYTVTDNNGCTSVASAAKTITVNPLPTITTTPTVSRCGAGSVTLTATASIVGSTIDWYSVATGGTSLFTGSPFTTTVSGNTNFYVSATSPLGCASSPRTTVVVTTDAIYVNNSSQCLNVNSFQFSVGCPTSGATYIWNFGDGTTFTGQTPPAKVYTQAGNYSVQLIARVGNIDTYYSLPIAVNPMPVASFVTYVNTGNGSSYSFQSSSTIQGGSMSYAWAFGDGNTGTGDNVQHTFATSGNKNVTLTVTSNAGCVNSTTTAINVVITGGGGSGGAGPLTITPVLGTSCASASHSFSATGTLTGPTTYSWSFQDGSPATSTAAAPTGITFTSAGTKTISLTYVDNGVTYTAAPITVTVNPAPVASFSYSNTGGNNYSFFNGSYISNSSALTYAWTFSNGATPGSATAQNPTAVLASGTTVVTLQVTGSGCTATTTQNIVVNAPAVAPPVASITFAGANPQCITSNSFTFGVNSTGGAIASYQWSIPNANVTGGTTASPTAVFTQPGTYNITLTVSNASGSYSTQYANIIVLAIPNVSFSYSNSANVYTFTPSAWASNGSIASYEWVVDAVSQGVNTSASNLVQTLSVGSHTIVLNVSTGLSCSNTYSQTINVAATAIAPVADITLSSGTQTQCLNSNSYAFSPNVSGGTPSTYQWYFQNGTPSSSTAAGPHTVTFSQPGTHTVQLYVSNSAGNSTATYNVTINNAPQPTVSASGTTYFCDGGTVTLTSSVATSYQWYKDAVLIGGATAQTYAATTAGVYTVVATYSGCASVASNGTTVTVVAAPSQPTIAAGGATTFCNGSSVTLTSSTGNSYQWYLNGSAISGANGSTYNATATGNYTVAVTNSNGCASIQSTATSVTVNPAATTPVITAASATTFCAPGSVTLSTVHAGPNYQWYKDGVAVGTSVNNFVATASGVYTLVVNNGTCPSAASNAITVTVNDAPTASYNLLVNNSPVTTGGTINACASDDYSFISTSTTPSGSISLSWSFGASVTYTNGTGPTSNNPRLYYTAAGSYPATLTVTGSNGCTSTYTSTIVVSNPIAAFTPTVNYAGDIYSNPTVSIVNNSTGASSYTWSTTGTPSIALTGPTPTNYTYSTGGSKTITLTAIAAGCTNTTSAPVSIVITPKSIISVHTTTADVTNPGGGGTTNYTTYTVTGFSNLANPSTIVTGSITNYYLLVEYRTAPFTGAFITYGSATNADITFSTPTSTLSNYEFKFTLITTSDLGVTDIAIANPSTATPYRGVNPNAPIVSIPTLDVNQMEKVLVYPNPSREFAKVNVKVPQQVSSVTVRVYSMNGKLVLQQKQDVIANSSANQNFNLNINNLASGTYTVVVVDDKGRIIGNTKMVKAIQ